MKFLLRSLLVLAVAVVFGMGLYYAVRVLPTDSPNPPSSEIQRPPENGTNASGSSTPRKERPEKDRGGFGLRSILGFARRVIVFSVMVFAAVLARNYIFERKPKGRKFTN